MSHIISWLTLIKGCYSVIENINKKSLYRWNKKRSAYVDILRGYHNFNITIYIYTISTFPLPSRLRDIWGRRDRKIVRVRRWMTPKKQQHSNIIIVIHIWTHRDCDSTHRLCTGSSQTVSQQWKEEVDMEFPQSKKLFAIETCWEKGLSFLQ